MGVEHITESRCKTTGAYSHILQNPKLLTNDKNKGKKKETSIPPHHPRSPGCAPGLTDMKQVNRVHRLNVPSAESASASHFRRPVSLWQGCTGPPTAQGWWASLPRIGPACSSEESR